MTTVYFAPGVTFHQMMEWIFARPYCAYAIQFDIGEDGGWVMTTRWEQL